MPKSMTAYGRATIDFEGAHFTVEVQSVNRKHLDIQVHLPRLLSLFETEVRKKVGAFLNRGLVTVKAQVVFHEKAPYKVDPNIALAKEIKKAWEEIAGSLKLEEKFKLEYLLPYNDILTFETDENAPSLKGLLKALDEALEHFSAMSRAEGELLKADMLLRLDAIEANLKLIEGCQEGSSLKMRQKFIEKWQNVIHEPQVDERVLKEIAFMVDKLDITEEIVRFKSHISQYKKKLGEAGQGKPLEFLTQEMGREINTIGSKSQDIVIANAVIDIKADLERMREQLQNME